MNLRISGLEILSLWLGGKFFRRVVALLLVRIGMTNFINAVFSLIILGMIFG
jgi:hypothetical protein